MSIWSRTLVRALAMALILATGAVFAQTEGAAEKIPVKLDPQADKVLKDVSSYALGLKSCSFDSTYTMAISAEGSTQTMTARHAVSVARPNQVAILFKDGAMGGTLVSDGKTLSFYFPALQKYLVREAPATLDDLVNQPETTMALGGMSVVTSLLKSDPYADIMADVTEQQYLGTEKVGDIECHHIKLLQNNINWEAWISTGDKPLLMKVVPDLTKMFAGEEGMPKDMKMESSFTFGNWVVNQAIPPETFKFTPPEGAAKVDNLEQLMQRSDDQPSALLGKPAPAFSVDLLNGGKLDIEAAKGKSVVVLDFWATWCPPCRKSMPILDGIAAAYKDKGVSVYAVNQGEDAEKVTPFLAENKLSLTVAMDTDRKGGHAYGVEAIPTTVIIDKAGIVQSVHVGLDPELKTKLASELDALLAGKSLLPAPEPEKTPAPETK